MDATFKTIEDDVRKRRASIGQKNVLGEPSVAASGAYFSPEIKIATDLAPKQCRCRK
eukprot:EC719931.1.p4 GENE.EC719931.1~~EC719931.1.p4  ORF type:complete len:57 (+),score=6.49 EC719931.1:34-204(+)